MKKKSKKSGSLKPVKINDGSNTIIFIGANENKEKAIKKYLKDLEESKYAGEVHFHKGRASNLKK